MNEKHLLQTAGIDAQDWERTPVSVRKLVVQLSGKIEQHVKELQVSNEQLEEKVNCNSKNSHSPPASDSPNVENTKKKKPVGKKRGGQPGHPGHSRPLYLVEDRLRREGSEAVSGAVEEAKAYVQSAAIVGADETGFGQGYADGQNPHHQRAWLWVAVTPLVSFFQVMLSRSTAAAMALLGNSFGGILNSDRALCLQLGRC